MPADSILTLFKLRQAAEPAIVSALADVGAANVYSSFSAVTIVTPCLSIRAILGSVNGKRFQPPTMDLPTWDQWAISIEGTVRTNRNQNADQHADYEAYLRLVMLDIDTRVNPKMEFHQFNRVSMEDGIDTALDEENNHDLTIMRFSNVFAIKPDAWPAAT